MPDTKAPEPKAWEQLPDEPAIWFDRFTRFRMLGPARSLIAVYRKEPKPKGSRRRKAQKGTRKYAKVRKGTRDQMPGAWKTVARRWKWLSRAEAWDADQRHVDEQVWTQRREEWRGQEWDLATRMGKRIDETLKQKVSTGDLNPQDLKYTADALEKSSKVARLSLGLVTERQAHEIGNAEDAKERLADRIRSIADRLAAQGAAGSGDPGVAGESPAE